MHKDSFIVKIATELLESHIAEAGEYVLKYYASSLEWLKERVIAVLQKTANECFPILEIIDYDTMDYEVTEVENCGMTVAQFAREYDLELCQSFLEIGDDLLFEALRNFLEEQLTCSVIAQDMGSISAECEGFDDISDYCLAQGHLAIPWLDVGSTITDVGIADLALDQIMS